MRNLRAVYIIWYRDILRFWHDRMRMMGAIIMPLLFLFIFGSGLSSSMTFGDDIPIDYINFMFPGVISMSVLTSALMGGTSLVWDKEFGFLKEVLVAPVSRASVAIGKVLGASTLALIPGLIIMIFAPVIGVDLPILTVLKLLPLMFLLAVSISSLGILLATRMKSMEAFQMIMQLLMMPMIFLSGVFFPLRNLPAWLNFITKINPASYGVAPIREVALGKEMSAPFSINLFGHTMSLWENTAIVATFGAVMIILAMWSFNRQE
ncbi:ABC transporter permease [Chloroflexota bacterium]